MDERVVLWGACWTEENAFHACREFAISRKTVTKSLRYKEYGWKL